MMNESQAIDYAVSMGWTKADAGRAFEGLEFPAELSIVLNKMVQFAGPELYKRQRLQGAQRGVATKNKNLLKQLEDTHQEMIDDYEAQLANDRSNFVGIIRIIYEFAKQFGYKDAWIETLLSTYDQHGYGNEKEAA